MAVGLIGGCNLLKGTGLNGAVVPDWFCPSTFRDRDQLSFQFSLIAGTATYFLEGKNMPEDAAVQLATGSASAVTLVPKMNYLRCRLSASTGAQVVGSVNSVLVDTGA